MKFLKNCIYIAPQIVSLSIMVIFWGTVILQFSREMKPQWRLNFQTFKNAILVFFTHRVTGYSIENVLNIIFFCGNCIISAADVKHDVEYVSIP